MYDKNESNLCIKCSLSADMLEFYKKYEKVRKNFNQIYILNFSSFLKKGKGIILEKWDI